MCRKEIGHLILVPVVELAGHGVGQCFRINNVTSPFAMFVTDTSASQNSWSGGSGIWRIRFVQGQVDVARAWGVAQASSPALPPIAAPISNVVMVQ